MSFLPGMSVGFLAQRSVIFPVFVGAGPAVCGSGEGPSLSAPGATQVGDLLVLAVMSYGTVEPSSAMGYSLIGYVTSSGTVLTVFAKIAEGGGSDGTTVTLGAGGNSGFGVIAAYRGEEIQYPSNYATDIGINSVSYYPFTSMPHNAKVLQVVGGLNGTGSPMSGTPGGGYLEDVDVSGNDTFGQAWYNICFDTIDVPLGGNSPEAGHSTNAASLSLLLAVYM